MSDVYLCICVGHLCVLGLEDKFGEWFSPSIRWDLGTKPRSPIKVASVFIHSHLAAHEPRSPIKVSSVFSQSHLAVHHSFTSKPVGQYKIVP